MLLELGHRVVLVDDAEAWAWAFVPAWQRESQNTSRLGQWKTTPCAIRLGIMAGSNAVRRTEAEIFRTVQLLLMRYRRSGGMTRSGNGN